MTIFNQKLKEWAGISLGESEYKMGGYGCLTTDFAQALVLAGYDVNPRVVVEAFNGAAVYTDKNYSGGAGLLQWFRAALAFPQIQIALDGTRRYKFIQVIASYDSGRFEHWVLLADGMYYDPIDGSSSRQLKPNYRATTLSRSADIIPAPVVLAEVPAPTGQVADHDVNLTVMFDQERTVTVIGTNGQGLNCRNAATSASGFFKLLPDKSSYFVKGYKHGEDVNGNDVWYLTRNDHWFSAFYTNQPNP